MNKKRGFLFGLVAAVMLSDSGPVPAGGGETYALAWADEFDCATRPDERNWRYETGFVRNDELQWYQPANARCRDGMLVIEARRERKINTRHVPFSRDWRHARKVADYTSASLTTQGLHQWQYGRFEIRARIDTRAGLWPAIWTLGAEGGWPRGGEIDIMEYYRGQLLANVATGDPKGGGVLWDKHSVPLASFADPSWPQRFHIWRMDWNEDTIRLEVDGHLLNTIDVAGVTMPDGFNPLRQPHALLISLAVGGSNGGDPSQTRFPARLEVDYVRVYRRRH